jgi:hypothetical protein
MRDGNGRRDQGKHGVRDQSHTEKENEKQCSASYIFLSKPSRMIINEDQLFLELLLSFEIKPAFHHIGMCSYIVKDDQTPNWN